MIIVYYKKHYSILEALGHCFLFISFNQEKDSFNTSEKNYQ